MEALTHDVFDYITKPFKKEQILHTVNKAMRWQRMKREAAATAALFEREPYTEAESAFQAEYVRRLADRCEGAREAVAERSGLPAERVAECLADAGTPAS